MMRIEVYSQEHEAAARAFNQRMRAANAPIDFLLPDTASAARAPGPVVSQTHVVLEEEIVRGGVIVQEQPHWAAGRTCNVWNVQSPLSEGLVDRRFGFVAAFMMNELLRRNPLIYSVGMGAESRPYPRLLKALRWLLTEVPFYFHVCNARAFLRGLRALRVTRKRRALLDAAALSGLGPLAIHALQSWRTERPSRAVIAEPCESFGAWADEIWEAAKHEYSLCAVRSQETLSCVHKRPDRLRVIVDGRTVGWAAVLVRSFRDHRHFGNLRVGMIVDCLAPRAHAAQVVQAAADALRARDVDLIVSNQLHDTWRAAFERCGFLSGPSNYLFGASRELARMGIEGTNINRGDGDGIAEL